MDLGALFAQFLEQPNAVNCTAGARYSEYDRHAFFPAASAALFRFWNKIVHFSLLQTTDLDIILLRLLPARTARIIAWTTRVESCERFASG